MFSLLKKIVGSRNDRLLKQYRVIVKKINALEPSFQALSDEELVAKTPEFRQRLAQGESLDSLLPEAFALVREAAQRVLGMRHFDVQLIGGIALHQGKIAEMRTGEGKTLMSTLPIYLNALTGKGVHVVTVNDYLARRDARNNGRLFNFLGMTVGVVVPHQDNAEKIAAYRCDITYGTNNEFGFDYLRDNMEHRLADRRQVGLHYAIVDEVDSILIDEARTPLIISGQADDSTDMYRVMDFIPPLLTPMAVEPNPKEPEPEGDYWLDEKTKQVHLSEVGHEKAEQILTERGILPEGQSLYDPRNIPLMHHLILALRAHTLFFKERDYVVLDGEVVIVDEFTGRFMKGRRWSDGLHQAIEAKEGVTIQKENQTLASVTFQNYFRMYEKLAGMTGTADTEAYEFQQIYGLETVIIPTNLPMIRQDQNDQIFIDNDQKYAAIIKDIRDCHERGQPVLVGTTSIENSEIISALLKKEGLKHEVLNAKQHAREAEIVAEAGKPGHITIATNMAGRGTDIVLGGSVEGAIQAVRADEALTDEQKAAQIEAIRQAWLPLNEQVKAAGGLRIIGTERHESRRIDNQLRGRAGRQGDPGSSRFYLSLDDPLMRIFAGDRIRALMMRLGQNAEPIEARMVSRSIETAQRRVEGHNFDIRKQLLEYDDVSNDQRKVIYSQRNQILESTPEQMQEMIANLRDDALEHLVRQYVPADSMEEQWDIPALQQVLESEWGLKLSFDALLADEDKGEEDILAMVLEAGRENTLEKQEQLGEAWQSFQTNLLLQTIDTKWREHLSMMDYLRQGIGLRSYAQQDPKQAYKREAFNMFSAMLDDVRDEFVRFILVVKMMNTEALTEASEQMDKEPSHIQYSADELPDEAYVGVGRNDLCPCGSGKKFKHCHGQLS